MVTAARGSSTNPFWTSFQRTAKLDRAVADSGRILNFSALLAKFQYPFCLARISFLLYNPIVFRSKALPQFLGAAPVALRKTGFQPRRLQRRRQLQPGVESDSCPSGSTMCCYGIRVPARMLSRRIFAIVARMLFTPTLSDAIRSLHQTYSGMTADS